MIGMKKAVILIFILALMAVQPVSAKKLFIYTEFGGGYGNMGSAKFGINAIYNGFTYGICFYGQHIQADYVPPDYGSGLVILGPNQPQQYLRSTCFTFGKVFYMGDPHIRLVMKGGLALSSYEYPDYYTRVTPGWFDSNYQIDWANKSALGLYINPTMEFPLSAAFGLSVGGWANINAVKSSFGVEGNILLGRVRARIHRGGK